MLLIAVLALCALVFPVPALVGGVLCFDKTRRAIPCALICAIAMSAIASGMQTGSEPDLWRYQLYTESLKGVPFSDAFSFAYGNLPLATIWFWLAAQTGNSFLMQASVAFEIYFVAFYIVFDVAKRGMFELRHILLACLCVLCLLPLFSSTSAMRSSAALLIGVCGLYLNVVRGKSGNAPSWVLMIIPVFIHTAGYMIIAVRLLYAVFKKSRLTALLVTVLFIPIAVLLANLVRPIDGGIASRPIDLLFQYTDWTTGYAEIIVNNHYHQVLRACYIVFLVLLVIDCLFSRKDQNYLKGEAFNNLAILVLLFTGIELGFTLYIATPSYLRFCYASAPLATAYLAWSQSSRSGESTKDATIFASLKKLVRISTIAITIPLCALHLHNMLYYVYPEPFVHSLLFGYLGIPLQVI